MKIDLFDIDKFVAENHCPKVSNPVFFNYDGTPTSDGLFSYELFGSSDEDRKNIIGYVDLNFHAIHPVVYTILTSRMGSFKQIITGEKYAVIADKKVKIVNEDFPDAETGIDFFYNHFDEIDWINAVEESETESLDKKTRLKFLKSLKKNEFFVSKWLILPPYYRAENSSNRTMGDQINKLYKELISRCRSLKTGFSFSLFGAETKLRIQNLLRDIYFSTMAPASGKQLVIEKGKTEGELRGSGKNSMIRKNLLGKALDFTSSAVITSPHNSLANTIGQKPVPFGYSAFPLATLLSLFHPFFIAAGVQMMESTIMRFAQLYGKDIKKIDLGQYNNEVIDKLIVQFVRTPKERFSPLTISYIGTDGKKHEETLLLYEFKNKNDAKAERNYIEREFTLTDLFYLIASDVLADKHVYVTRYPVSNIQNIFPVRVKTLTTVRTHPAVIKFSLGTGDNDNLMFSSEEYPNIKYNGSKLSETECNFLDVMICGNAYLDSLGGDYDGDMLYLKSVFTKEANDEAERLIFAKTNMINSTGGVSRGLAKIGKENVMGLYEMSKDVD